MGLGFPSTWPGGRLVPLETTLSALILSLRGDSLSAAAELVPGTAPGALSSSPGWGIQWLILTSPATLQLSLAFSRPPRVPLQAMENSATFSGGATSEHTLVVLVHCLGV